MHKVLYLMAAFCCLITLSACAKKQQTVIEQTAEYMRAGLENQQTGTVQSAVSQDASAESDEAEQPDGSIIIHIKKQYNNHSCEEYMG